MRTWAPLWSSIVDSSVWDEPDYVVKIFLTMIALKDSDHIYRGTAYNLSTRSRKTEVEVLEALRILSSPDSKRVGHQEFEGRRIRAVEEGWLILNGEKYREQVQIEMRRARNRRAQAAYRAKKKQKALKGEDAYVEAMRNGDEDRANEILTNNLPRQCQ